MVSIKFIILGTKWQNNCKKRGLCQVSEELNDYGRVKWRLVGSQNDPIDPSESLFQDEAFHKKIVEARRFLIDQYRIIFDGIKKSTMSEYNLPNGVYILNNGPKKKSVGGRFFNGRTHEDIKKLFQHKSGIQFTSKPEKADYVLLPEGVREPGKKLLTRNTSLADSRLWFSFDKISNTLYSKSYSRAKKVKTKSSDSYTYVLKDVNSGRTKSLEIPKAIAPD